MAGLAAARSNAYDLILLDLSLPELDGWSVARALSEDGRPTPPIVALTGHAMKGEDARAREAGCSGYLAKPLDLDALRHVIQNALPGLAPG